MLRCAEVVILLECNPQFSVVFFCEQSSLNKTAVHFKKIPFNVKYFISIFYIACQRQLEITARKTKDKRVKQEASVASTWASK